MLALGTDAVPDTAWLRAEPGTCLFCGGDIAKMKPRDTMTEGEYDFFTVDSCVQSDTCYAINPITPYGLFYLPAHPNETAGGAGNYTNSCHRHNICKEVPDTRAGAPAGATRTLSPCWRLAPGDAVVLTGRTPPEATYWSFTNYLYTRFHDAGPSEQNFLDLAFADFSAQQCWLIRRRTWVLRSPGWVPAAKGAKKIVACKTPPEGGAGLRCETFAGINDPVNLETVNTTGGAGAFDAPFALVLATDADTEARVVAALASGGPYGLLTPPAVVPPPSTETQVCGGFSFTDDLGHALFHHFQACRT